MYSAFLSLVTLTFDLDIQTLLSEGPSTSSLCISRKSVQRFPRYLSDKQKSKQKNKLECGPMPNVMVALPNTGGALCSTPQSLADAHYLTAVQ